MPTIHLEAQVSADELLDAVEQLAPPELDRFMSKVLALFARSKGPSLPPEEADLLLQINRDLPADLRARLRVLNEKREDGALTEEEHAELLRLNEAVEAFDVERLSNLSRLAQIRGVPLRELLDKLGIRGAAQGDIEAES